MASDTMRVRLHLRLIRVLTVLVDSVNRSGFHAGCDVPWVWWSRFVGMGHAS